MASAEGLELFTTGVAISASELRRHFFGDRMALKQGVRITLNKAAIESKVIAVRFEGKTYRYVGKKNDTGESETWNGRDADGSPLWVSCSQSGVIGQIGIGRRMFLIVCHAGEPILAEIA